MLCFWFVFSFSFLVLVFVVVFLSFPVGWIFVALPQQWEHERRECVGGDGEGVMGMGMGEVMRGLGLGNGGHPHQQALLTRTLGSPSTAH